MILIGLTGSIGMGKSTTSAMFRAAGLPVYDADAAVHRLYAGPAVEALRADFREAIVAGKVDRAILSQMIMRDRTALRRLESIIHPLVAQDRSEFLAGCRGRGFERCVLDVPLLFETGGDTSVDVIVVVSAAGDVQMQRVLARPEMTREKFETILGKQMPDNEKRRRAHFVVDTGGGIAFAERQVAALLNAIGH
ncbi:MAG: dephospho-CoA kinase [Hyphomicrobiales bacterium]|nr:dephospho-CoA kinase [Hyphomicrobiales bacterium]